MSPPPKLSWLHRTIGPQWPIHLCFLLVGGAVATVGLFLRYSSSQSQISISAQAASRIHKALMLYAHDHGGQFPTATRHANEAYRQLIPDYFTDEREFYVPGSAWHDAAPGRKPDNLIGPPPTYPKSLERGENHWAYVSGLNTSSPSNLPIIADGFVEWSPGQYTEKQRRKGGVWKDKAIFVYTSGAAQIRYYSAKSGYRILKKEPATGRDVDVFALPTPPPGAPPIILLNPE